MKMKKFNQMAVIVSMMSFLVAAAAFASTDEDIVLSERDVCLSVEINSTNLKWSQADYAAPVVKVLVPELAGVTILNHRNTKEGAPCLASYEAKSPEQVIGNSPGTDKVDFHLKLSKSIVMYPDKTKCDVYLRENIDAKIRGVAFTHERSVLVGQRTADDCK